MSVYIGYDDVVVHMDPVIIRPKIKPNPVFT